MNYFDTPAEAETAFYSAFRQCSVAEMRLVWAEGDVTCVHPGSEVLQGKPEIMQSWARILVEGMTASIDVEPVSYAEADGLAVHTVYEHLVAENGQSPVTVVATNVFKRNDRGWNMIGHHGSQPVRRLKRTDQNTPDRVLQ